MNEFANTKANQVIQFILDPKTIVYGSIVQKISCKNIEVPAEKCAYFCAKVGEKELGESI